MPRDPVVAAGFDFLDALMQRGFVNIPRMLFDYMGDLELDYDTVGKLFAVLACVGGTGENSYRPYTISRKTNPHDYDMILKLVLALTEKEMVLLEESGDTFTFSLIPLFSRLRAIWGGYRQSYEEEIAATEVDSAPLAAERLLGRPLSGRELDDIADWQSAYGFDTEMVEAIIREGQRQGVTRMSYLNTVARRWHEDGIQTPEEAEAHAERHRKAAGKHKAIISYLGLKRQLTGAEQTLLEKWTTEWGFSNELIFRACDEANGVQNPLQYINRILESWHEQGVRTSADVDRVLAEYKRTAAEAAQKSGKPARERTAAQPPSNVFLRREKMKNYDHVFKKFDD